MNRNSVSGVLLSILGWTLLFHASGAEESPLGLVLLVHPAANPRTEAKVMLGRTLFFDKTLSRDGSISCATCHKPDEAFAQRGVARSIGVDDRVGRRNAPSLLNVGFAQTLFFDGRSSSLEDQAWEPILAADEMGNGSEEAVLERLRASEVYPRLFKDAFGSDTPDKAGVAKALACFQRTLVSGDSPFDRWNSGGESEALSEEAHAGYQLFIGRAQCWQCHPLNSESALLMTDHTFHNTGVSVRHDAEGKPIDLGRMEVTDERIDRLQFKTPSLRNVALTPPYMHDGSILTLPEVVRFYDRAEGGGGELFPLDLDDAEIDALVAFLESFTSPSAQN